MRRHKDRIQRRRERRETISRLLIVALILIAGTASCETRAQTPAPSQPTAEQKRRLKEAAQTWEQKSREAEAAKDKYLVQLFAILAELGLKPSETTITWNDKGEPVFNRAEAAKKVPDSKPEAKP